MGVSGDGGSSRKGGKRAGAPQGSPGCQAKSRSKLLLWAQTAFSSSLALAEAPHSSQCEQAEPPDALQPPPPPILPHTQPEAHLASTRHLQ